MPVEAVAVRLLAFIADKGPTTPVSRHSTLMEAKSEVPRNQPFLHAVAEAWDWLFRHGLIVDPAIQEGWFVASRLGERVASDPKGLERIQAAARIDLDLHPRLAAARQQFIAGELELAVFAAMKEVEVRVRFLSMGDAGDIGVSLVRKAFGEHGLLRNHGLERGEQEAISHLFAGALGTFKNPVSHRPINYDDAVLASEAILLADLLLRMLDRDAARLREHIRETIGPETIDPEWLRELDAGT